MGGLRDCEGPLPPRQTRGRRNVSGRRKLQGRVEDGAVGNTKEIM